MSIPSAYESVANNCSATAEEWVPRHTCPTCCRESATEVCPDLACASHAKVVKPYTPDYEMLAQHWQFSCLTRAANVQTEPDEFEVQLQEKAELSAVRGRVRRSHSTHLESRWV